MASPAGTTKRKANKKSRGTPGRRNGRSASSSPTKKKQNKARASEPKVSMNINEIAGANGAEAAAAAKAENENVGGKQPEEEKEDAIFTSDTIHCEGARFLLFGFKGCGDHQGIVIDVSYASLVGQAVHRVAHPDVRRLNTDIPGCEKAYITELELQMQSQGVDRKAVELHVLCDVLSDDEFCYKFDIRRDKVDAARQACMERAEKKCRKLRMGEVDFSPGIDVWRKRKEVWELVCRRL